MIAAEICGLSLGDILELIASGKLLSRMDGSFRFVRLPHFAVFGQRLPIERRPRTYNVVPSEKTRSEPVITPAEASALAGETTDKSEMGPPPDEDPDDNRICGWREGRRQASRLRRGPPPSESR
jgi:hypothetical protein